MSIAQHSVAGEDVAHLDATDADAFVAFTSDPTNLPWLTFRAVHRANQIQQLPARARAVLAALARTVDAKKPFSSIYAGRSLLTGRALQSMRTFYRALDDLESAGLIERPPQVRYVADGTFGRAYLHLTAAAAELLGLVPMAKREASSEQSGDRTREGADDETFSSTPCDTVAHGRIQGDLNPTSFQKRQPGQLPPDLERLQTLGIHRYMVFKLMAEARRAGKRLSDVVEYAWAYLCHASRPIRYLRKLFQSSTDFGYLVTAQRGKAAAEQRAREAELEAKQHARRSAGRTFYAPDGSRRYDVAPDASGITVTVAAEGVPRGMGAGWEIAFAEACSTGRAIAATPTSVAAYDAIARQRSAVPAPQRLAVAMGPRELTAVAGDHLNSMMAALRAGRRLL
ncbi:Replication protein O [Burkholderia territorii]|nr:Replication protein O [Burkholderia territorii]